MKKLIILGLVFTILAGIILPAMLVSEIAGPEDKVLGYWRQVDDKTGEERSIVKIYRDTDGKISGRLIWTNAPKDENGEYHMVKGRDYSTYDGKPKPILGFKIMWGIKYSEKKNLWGWGSIYDPEEGKKYGVSLEIAKKDGKSYVKGDLILKGWFGFISRAQFWKPADVDYLKTLDKDKFWDKEAKVIFGD